MTDAELERALAAVDLPRPGYWQAQYLKNVDQLSKPQYRMIVERDEIIELFGTEDAHEGISAFVEKRRAAFH